MSEQQTAMHYAYLTPTFNGLRTVGTTVGFCGAVRIRATPVFDEVTCTACREHVLELRGGAA